MQTLEQRHETALLPNQKRWTVEECDRIAELGLLSERYELIEGVIVTKMGSGGKHSQLVRLLMRLLMAVFGVERVMVQLPIRIPNDLGRYNSPEPDIAITHQPEIAYSENPLAEDILLVAEVSDSSFELDMTIKARLYAQTNIPEYWVVDVERERLIVHRQPNAEGYEEITAYTKGEAIAPLNQPAMEIAISTLFAIGQENRGAIENTPRNKQKESDV